MKEAVLPFKLPPAPVDRHTVTWFRAIFQGDEARIAVVCAIFHTEGGGPESADPWWEITVGAERAKSAFGWEGLALSRPGWTHDFAALADARAFVFQSMTEIIAAQRERLRKALQVTRAFLPVGVEDAPGVPVIHSPLDMQAALHGLIASRDLGGVVGVRGVAGSGPLAFELALADGSALRMTAERIPARAPVAEGIVPLDDGPWRLLSVLETTGLAGLALSPASPVEPLVAAGLIEPVPFRGVDPSHDASGSARADAEERWKKGNHYRTTPAGSARLKLGQSPAGV